MCPSIIKTNDSVITHFKNTLISTVELQSKLKSKVRKKCYDFESVVMNDDIVEKALRWMKQDGYTPISLDKYDVELSEDGEGIKVTLEFTCKEPLTFEERYGKASETDTLTTTPTSN